MEKIKVLVVDDSALMRKLITQIIEKDEQLEVVATAMNGKFALQKLLSMKPDVMTLDIEMPQMNGLEFLQEKAKAGDKTPVIVLSSLTSKGSIITMEALEYGAVDYIQKPSGSISLDIEDISEEILLKLKNWALKSRRIYLKSNKESTIADYRKIQIPIRKRIEKLPEEKEGGSQSKSAEKVRNEFPMNPRFIALGISTGGPEALRTILPHLKTNIPIVIIQHMPPIFTFEFAKSLSKILTQYRVKEAENGDILTSGNVYIAPGGKQLAISKRDMKFEICINDDEPMNNHRPSVDYFFKSIYDLDVTDLIGIIMTGMGKDGAFYITKLRYKGIFCIGQDEETSIVYGMPKVALEYGGLDIVLPLLGIPEFLNKNLKNI